MSRPAPPVRGQGRGGPGRRWRLAGAIAAVIVTAVAAGLALAVSRPGQLAGGQTGQGGSPGPGRQAIVAEDAARGQAVNWVASQVSRAAIVACDPVTCAALAARGFPAAGLDVLGPTAPDPFGADVLIATASLRSTFGSKLAGVYAPVVIAGFGRGGTRIEVRVIAPDGAAAYRAELAADVLARKASAAALLRNRRLTVSPAARRELIAGQVDSRLLSAIAFLVHQRPVAIVDFGSLAPGAAPGVPLRFADLAETGAAVQPGGTGYVRSVLAVLGTDTSLYRPASNATVRLTTGQQVLRIGFAAPSPLGLLGSGGG